MIKLVEGSIGSGKTYFVVSEILKNHFVWDDENVCYKPVDDSLEIYTNIDSFRYGKDLKYTIEQNGGVDNFFTIDFQKQFTSLKRHLYVIDEAQMLFPRKYYNTKVFNFFQYLRHMGIDVYMITQDIYSLVRELQTLNEYHIKVVRRSFSMLGEFRYNYMSGQEILKRKILKSDKRVFAQYRSSLQGIDSHKTKRFSNKFFIYVVGLVLLIFAGGYGFLYMFTNGKYFERKSKIVAAPVSKKSPVRVETRSIRLIAVNNDVGYFSDADGKVIKKKIK